MRFDEGQEEGEGFLKLRKGGKRPGEFKSGLISRKKKLETVRRRLSDFHFKSHSQEHAFKCTEIQLRIAPEEVQRDLQELVRWSEVRDGEKYFFDTSAFQTPAYVVGRRVEAGDNVFIKNDSLKIACEEGLSQFNPEYRAMYEAVKSAVREYKRWLFQGLETRAIVAIRDVHREITGGLEYLTGVRQSLRRNHNTRSERRTRQIIEKDRELSKKIREDQVIDVDIENDTETREILSFFERVGERYKLENSRTDNLLLVAATARARREMKPQHVVTRDSGLYKAVMFAGDLASIGVRGTRNLYRNAWLYAVTFEAA